MQYFIPCIVFYNSDYIQPDDLREIVEELKGRLLSSQYQIPIFLKNISNESIDIENLLARYEINRIDITDRPVFVIEHGLTKQKFPNMDNYLQALNSIMRPPRS